MLNNGRGDARALLRVLLLAPAVAGVLWSAAALPSFLRMVPAAAAAEGIIGDDRFKPSALTDVLARISAGPEATFSQSKLMRARALIQLRVAEDAMARKSSEEADREAVTAEKNLMMALAVSPSDSFLWLMLYSVETSRNGFNSKNVSYLERSYATGPREGWISLRRNRLALAVFSSLGEAMRSSVTEEFVEMVDADFIESAVFNLAGVGWPNQSHLVSALSRADIISREAFGKRVAREGIKIDVPGVTIGERPWQ